MMKNRVFVLLLVSLMLLSGCHKHVFTDATCNEPKKCEECGKTEGNPTENHKWKEATVLEPKTCEVCKVTEGNPLTVEEFENQLSQLPVKIGETGVYIWDIKFDGLYLYSFLYNNSGKDIKTIYVDYLVYDENNYPLSFPESTEDDAEGYLIGTRYRDINLTNGSSFEERDFGRFMGAGTDYEKIKKVKAIVKKYDDFEGNTWENPYYDAWIELYRNKPLK